jgi:hypothetical protein
MMRTKYSVFMVLEKLGCPIYSVKIRAGEYSIPIQVTYIFTHTQKANNNGFEKEEFLLGLPIISI